MENKTYDALKKVALVYLPALVTFVGTVGTALNWSYTGLAVTVITALDTALGTCLGISANKYNSNDTEQQQPSRKGE